MLFKIGVEIPQDDDTAYGIIVPALCQQGYTTVSAADTLEEITPMAREAAFTMMEEMAMSGDFDVVAIAKANKHDFSKDPEYAEFTDWTFVDIDVDGIVKHSKPI